MKVSPQESLELRYGSQSSVQLILEVAKAVGSHLELAAVLESLLGAIKPLIHFHAIAVFVVEGEYVRLHSLHVDGLDRRPGEPVESIVARAASSANVPPKPVVKQLTAEHHMSEVALSHRPYVCTDLERQKRFREDERLLQYGVRSYVSLPLLKRGETLGAVDFISFEKRDFEPVELQLLQDVSEIVSIAVSNALAYEEIKTLKEQLQAENRLLQD